MESASVYTYDVGFSFAGEARRVVETVNDELKAEDVVTFYDFDDQAVLLALDLQSALDHIYAESCRYDLVFLDRHYKEKVWTSWEQDIMTHSGRRGHIVPVVLDEEGERGVVGISSTLGRIELKEVLATVQRNGAVDDDGRVSIRNRRVLPMPEKLDAWMPGEATPPSGVGPRAA
jgi:hypothetical protein